MGRRFPRLWILGAVMRMIRIRTPIRFEFPKLRQRGPGVAVGYHWRCSIVLDERVIGGPVVAVINRPDTLQFSRKGFVCFRVVSCKDRLQNETGILSYFATIKYQTLSHKPKDRLPPTIT